VGKKIKKSDDYSKLKKAFFLKFKKFKVPPLSLSRTKGEPIHS